MEGGGDRQHHGALRAAKLRQFHGAFDRSFGARQNNLAAAIVVGGGANADAAGFRGDRFDVA